MNYSLLAQQDANCRRSKLFFKINNNYMIKNDLDKSLNFPESCLKIQAGGMFHLNRCAYLCSFPKPTSPQKHEDGAGELMAQNYSSIFML